MRVIRFYRFKKFIGDREIVALEELAEKFHTSKTKIRSELEMMIQHNYLLQGHVNQEFPCLITTDQKYKEYLQVLETLEQEKKEWEELGFDEEKRRSWSVHRAVFPGFRSLWQSFLRKEKERKYFWKICTSWSAA